MYGEKEILVMSRKIFLKNVPILSKGLIHM